MHILGKNKKNNDHSTLIKGRVICLLKDKLYSSEKEAKKFNKLKKITKFTASFIFCLNLMSQGLVANAAAINVLSKDSKSTQDNQNIEYSSVLNKNNKENIIAVIDMYGSKPNLPESKRIIDKLGSGWNGKDSSKHGTMVCNEVDKTLNSLETIIGDKYTENVKIMPINLENNYFENDVAKGIIWAVDNGADVINLSFGQDKYDEKVQKAVDYACKNNVILVASAGNDGEFIEHYPAQNNGVISVAAVSLRYVLSGNCIRASYSEVNEGVDFCAMQDNLEGTSFTAPQVAAQVDVIKQRLEEEGLEPTVDVVTETAKNAANNGKNIRDDETGWGIIDVYKAFDNIKKGQIPTGKDIEPPHAIFEQKGTNVSFKFFDDKGIVNTSDLKTTIMKYKNLANEEVNVELVEKDGKFTANLNNLPDGKYKIIVKGVKDSVGNSADIIRKVDINAETVKNS